MAIEPDHFDQSGLQLKAILKRLRKQAGHPAPTRTGSRG